MRSLVVAVLSLLLLSLGCQEESSTEAPDPFSGPSEQLLEIARMPNSPIVFDSRISEFSLLVEEQQPDGTTSEVMWVMRFDPFTGQPLGSGRAAQFVIPDEADLRSLKERTLGIEDVEAMIIEFGDPDITFPPIPGVRAQYDYYRLSDTVQLSVQILDDGTMDFILTGKPKEFVGRIVPGR